MAKGLRQIAFLAALLQCDSVSVSLSVHLCLSLYLSFSSLGCSLACKLKLREIQLAYSLNPTTAYFKQLV